MLSEPEQIQELIDAMPPVAQFCVECERECEGPLCASCLYKNRVERMKTVVSSHRQKEKKAIDRAFTEPLMCQCGHTSRLHGNHGKGDCTAMVERERAKFCQCKQFRLKENTDGRNEAKRAVSPTRRVNQRGVRLHDHVGHRRRHKAARENKR